MEPIKNRYDFVVLYDVENGNPNGDPDGDGFTNLEEYQLGTNPNRVNLPLTVTISKK